MELSAVDLSPVPSGGTATDAYADTVSAARQAEQLGFTRFWVAEHHGMAGSIAGTSPEVLLGHLAAETDSIRLGSGAVLLNHYSAYKVAEQFGVLDALAPGRIDAGLGRANGSPASDRALETDRYADDPDEEHAEKIEHVIKHLYDAFPSDHAYADLTIAGSDRDPPTPWVLGSSASSAKIAARLGLPYCFAAFIRPQWATDVFETYHENFEPTSLPGGVQEPRGIIAVNAVCGETDREAARMRAVAEATYKRMRRGEVGSRPDVEEAVAELGGVPAPTQHPLPEGEWPRAISGDPDTIADLFEQLADRVDVDEVMVQHVHASHEDALRSHERIAEGVGLV